MPDDPAPRQTEMPGFLPPRVWVQVAAFCETVLQEQSGIRTVVRIFDRLTVQVHQDEILAAGGVPHRLLVVLSLKCRKGDTAHEIVTQLTTPWGQVFQDDTPRIVDFAEDSVDEDAPAAFIQVNVPMLLRASGHYWFNVIANGEIITSIPLHITLLDRHGEPLVFEGPANE